MPLLSSETGFEKRKPTCTGTTVDDDTKSISNAFFLSYYFGGIEKLTQYLSMPSISLQMQSFVPQIKMVSAITMEGDIQIAQS